MSIAEIEIAISNLNELLNIKIEALQKNGIDSESMLEIAGYYRNIGCGMLLSRYDIEEYIQSLYKSAKTYQQLLENKNDNLEKYYLCKSKGLPLLDAIAIDQFDLARELTANMTKTWTENMEDIDDFIYFDIISDLIQEKPDFKLLETKLIEFENSLEGNSTNRLSVLKAIVEKSSDDFDVSLQSMILKIKKRIAKNNDSDYYYVTLEGNIFIEGIALIQIARKCGIGVNERYQYIPDIVFNQPEMDFPVDFSI
jgi:hypothetical protein